MYKIIGGDQREYGPVSADDIRRWISEGRLNSRSLARAENASDWKPLSQFREFAQALSGQATPPPLSGSTVPPANPDIWTAEILAREPQVPIGLCLTRSWELVKANFGLLFGASAVVWLISLAQLVPVLNLAYNVLAAVFYGGLCLIFLKRIRGEPAATNEVFSGFNLALGQLVLVGLISWVLTRIGLFCLCVLPGVYLLVAWVFAVPLVADKRLEFWSAMELSRKVVTRIWFPIFLLLVLAFLPVIAATLLAELKIAARVAPELQRVFTGGSQDFERMMRTLMRLNTASLSISFLTRLVLLFNLPFAVGAMMYAYENLFGPRTTANT